jgi:predicted nucleic acid-binding Zn ribbon protein
VIYLGICLWFGVAGAVVARIKGSSMVLWFLICAILPVFGLIALVLYRSDRDEPRRQCPGCGKVLKIHDALCTRCGTELEYPEVVLPPETAVRH